MTVHYADGWQFLADAAARGDRYDVVIVDLPDEPVEVDDPAQHARLYGAPFLRRCAEVLAPGGVVCSQAGCPTLWRHDTLARMTARFDDVFATVLPYCSDEHEWAYLTGRVDPLPAGADPVELAISRLARLPVTDLDRRPCPAPRRDPAVRAPTTGLTPSPRDAGLIERWRRDEGLQGDRVGRVARSETRTTARWPCRPSAERRAAPRHSRDTGHARPR